MSEATFARLSVQQALERLLAPQPTLVLFHINPDADAVGSAFALAELLRLTGSPAYCLCADEIPTRLRFMTDGLQESALVQSLPNGFENARVVAVDSASPTQLGRLFEQMGDRISLMIDHHEKGTPYADCLILPEAAATGEIVFDLIAAAGVEVSPRCGELLYAAISSDTGGFRYSNVTRDTHLRAAALVAGGVDVAAISHALLESKSRQELRAEQLGMEHMHLYDEGRIAIIPLSFEMLSAAGLEPQHLSCVIDVARTLAGVEVAAVIRQPDDAPRFRVSMRANVDFDVSAVCAVFGGGGHRRAAGAAVEAPDIAGAEAAVLQAILSLRSAE